MKKFNNLSSMPPKPWLSLLICLLSGFAASIWVEYIDTHDVIDALPDLRRVSATVIEVSSSEHQIASPSVLDPSQIREVHSQIHFRYQDLQGRLREYRKTVIGRPGTHTQAQLAVEKMLAKANHGSVDIYINQKDPEYLEWAFRVDRKVAPTTAEIEDDNYTQILLGITLGLFLYFLYGFACYLKRELFSGYDPNRID